MPGVPDGGEGVEVPAQKHTVLLGRPGAFDGHKDRGRSSYHRRSGCRKGTIAQGHVANEGGVTGRQDGLSLKSGEQGLPHRLVVPPVWACDTVASASFLTKRPRRYVAAFAASLNAEERSTCSSIAETPIPANVTS